jgi:hypothetical protein
MKPFFSHIPERLGEFYLSSAVKSLTTQGWRLVNLNIPASRIGTPSKMCPKTQNGHCLKNGYDDFY